MTTGQAWTKLSDLERVSAVDANALWKQLASHLRSARPQALMEIDK